LATKYWRSISNTSPRLAGAQQRLRHRRHRLLVLGGGAPRRPRGDQPLELAPGLEDEQLLLLVDLGDADAVPLHDDDEVVLGEALHRLAHGGAADAERFAQRRLRPEAAGRQLQGHDHLLQGAEG
jgi:hypothetical protein